MTVDVVDQLIAPYGRLTRAMRQNAADEIIALRQAVVFLMRDRKAVEDGLLALQNTVRGMIDEIEEEGEDDGRADQSV